jgi:hypothetical protein
MTIRTVSFVYISSLLKGITALQLVRHPIFSRRSPAFGDEAGNNNAASFTQLYFKNQFCITIKLLRTTYFEKPNSIITSHDRIEDSGRAETLVMLPLQEKRKTK